MFAPDLTNKKYKDLPEYEELCARFGAMKGSSVYRSLKGRQSLLELMGLVAGKWPNTLAVHPAGTTSTMNLSTKTRTIGILQEFVNFVENHLLGGSLEEWLDIDTFDKLENWLENSEHSRSDLGIFLKFCLKNRLDRLGRGPQRFLSYGSFEIENGVKWIRNGFYEEGKLFDFDQNLIEEHISHSYFRDAVLSRHPLSGVTVPYARKKGCL